MTHKRYDKFKYKNTIKGTIGIFDGEAWITSGQCIVRLGNKSEDPLLPGSDKPTIEKYDIPITAKYWGIDLGPGLDDYSITTFSKEVMNDVDYISITGRDSMGVTYRINRPIKKEKKINHIVSEHDKYMKLLRKYNKLKQKIRDLSE